MFRDITRSVEKGILFAQRERKGIKIKVCMSQEKGTISTSTGSRAVFSDHYAFSRQTDECHVIYCESLKGNSFTVSQNFVIVSSIMLNLENARALSIYHLLYNSRTLILITIPIAD